MLINYWWPQDMQREVDRVQTQLRQAEDEIRTLKSEKQQIVSREKDSQAALDRVEKTVINELNEECRRGATALGVSPRQVQLRWVLVCLYRLVCIRVWMSLRMCVWTSMCRWEYSLARSRLECVLSFCYTIQIFMKISVSGKEIRVTCTCKWHLTVTWTLYVTLLRPLTECRDI